MTTHRLSTTIGNRSYEITPILMWLLKDHKLFSDLALSQSEFVFTPDLAYAAVCEFIRRAAGEEFVMPQMFASSKQRIYSRDMLRNEEDYAHETVQVYYQHTDPKADVFMVVSAGQRLNSRIYYTPALRDFIDKEQSGMYDGFTLIDWRSAIQTIGMLWDWYKTAAPGECIVFEQRETISSDNF